VGSSAMIRRIEARISSMLGWPFLLLRSITPPRTPTPVKTS
jgi:hypothetical protein